MDILDEYRYRKIMSELDTILKGQHKLMALVDQEDSVLTDIEASLTTLGSGIDAVLAEVNAGDPFTQSHITRLQAISAALKGDVAELPAAAPVAVAAPPIAPTPGV